MVEGGGGIHGREGVEKVRNREFQGHSKGVHVHVLDIELLPSAPR
jgi:hypothetical protein